MILWSKIFAVFFLIVASITSSAQTTDIFSYENSLKYTDYLIKTHQYNAALAELNRMVNAYPDKDEAKELYIKTCYNTKRYMQGELKVEEWFINAKKPMPYSIMVRYNYLMLEQDNYNKFKVFNDTTSLLAKSVKQHIGFNVALLQENWSFADSVINSAEQNEYTEINLGLLNEGRQLRYKSTFKGGLYSALIPGMGKVYAKDGKDGVYSFLSVAIPAVSAIRGFNRKGNESVYGWVNLGLATFMYTGNIYGGVRSVRNYNKLKKQKYHAKVKGNIYNIY